MRVETESHLLSIVEWNGKPISWVEVLSPSCLYPFWLTFWFLWVWPCWPLQFVHYSWCSTKVARCLIPRFIRNSSTSLLMNCFTLSNIKVLRILNLHTTFFQMNLWILAIEIVTTGFTSIHFLKWSMPTRRNFTHPFTAGKDLTIYTPQVAKVPTMLCNSSGGRWDMLSNFRHSSHFFAYFVQSLLIIGQ